MEENNEKINEKKESKHIFGWFVCILYIIATLTPPFSYRNLIDFLLVLITCPLVIKVINQNTKVKVTPPIQVVSFFIIIAILNVYIYNNPNENLEATQVSNSNESVKLTQVLVPDFSLMEVQDIENFCNNNSIKCKFEGEYSDTIEKGLFVKQSVAPNEKVFENSTIRIYYSLGKEPTLGEKNALASAKNYLSFSSFSKKGLIKQLEFEGFSNQEAQYAVENCGADWNEQAAKSAQNYLSFSSFSKSGLIQQLKFEGFTDEQAQYGASAVGY